MMITDSKRINLLIIKIVFILQLPQGY
jgi:hypothetical protein